MKHFRTAVLSLMAAILTGCNLLSQALDQDQNNHLESVYYPFNDVIPKVLDENSLGFYASSIVYVQPLPNTPLVPPGRRYADCWVREPIDSMLIWSRVYARDYPYQDSKDDQIFFSSIAFLLTSDDVFANGTAYLEGDRVYLEDRANNVYQVLSATILFDQPTTDVYHGYHSGSFSVEYKDLDDKVCSLTGGRFKMRHYIYNSLTFSTQFSAIKNNKFKFIM